MNETLSLQRAAGWQEAQTLLSGSVRLRLFVVLRQTVDFDALPLCLGEHLRWLIEHETAGRVFLSGPIALSEGIHQLSSLIVLRVPTLAIAQAIAADDPFVKRGIVTSEVCEWTVNEGHLPLKLTLSNSTVSIG